jgi:hypothetical protein
MCVGEVRERCSLSLFIRIRIPKKNDLTLIESSKATPFLGGTLRIAIRHFTIEKGGGEFECILEFLASYYDSVDSICRTAPERKGFREILNCSFAHTHADTFRNNPWIILISERAKRERQCITITLIVTTLLSFFRASAPLSPRLQGQPRLECISGNPHCRSF